MVAAQEGNLNAILNLLGQGANATQQDNAGRTAYDYARANGHREIYDLLALQNPVVNDDNQTDLLTNRFSVLDNN